MINDVSNSVVRPMSQGAPSSGNRVDSRAAVESAQSPAVVERQNVAEIGNELRQQPIDANTDVKSAAEAVDINDTVDKLREHVKSLDRELEFSIDEDSGRTVITVRDPETDEVLRQIPPDELLYVVKALQENSANLFVEAKA